MTITKHLTNKSKTSKSKSKTDCDSGKLSYVQTAIASSVVGLNEKESTNMIQECFKQPLKYVNMILLLGMVLVLLLLHALASGGDDDDENEFKSDEKENNNVNGNNNSASQLINFELLEARLKKKTFNWS